MTSSPHRTAPHHRIKGTTKPCCGQGGNPVTPEYQCPTTAPTCVGYAFNRHFGHCVASVAPLAHARAKNTRSVPATISSSPLRPGTEFVFPQSTSPWTEPRCAVESANATNVVMMQPCWINLKNKACGYVWWNLF